MTNYFKLAQEIANDVKAKRNVSFVFHLNNGDTKAFYYNQSSNYYKQFTTNVIADRINDEWCQTLSDDDVVEKISIAKYSG